MKRYLMTPGPTPVPTSVLLAGSGDMIHHRTPDFEATVAEVTQGLKGIFGADNSELVVFAASGTGAMESAVVNCFSAGDTVLVAHNGKFGERFVNIAQAYQLEVIELSYEWNEVINPQDIAKQLESNPTIKGVFVTHSETASGVLNDVKAVGEIVNQYPNTLLIVDSITGIGAVECKAEAWHLDVLMTGSQKGLMMPPGLAAVSISAKALEFMQQSTLPKFYFNWAKAIKSAASHTTPFTPAVTLWLQLAESIRLINEEGLDNVIARHAKLAEAVRSGVIALGLELFAPPEGRGNAVTTVTVPEGLDGKVIVSTLKNKFGITIAGGQEQYAGKIFRIGHLGYVGQFDVIGVISALEMTLQELGYQFEQGSGVVAAEKVLMA